MHRYGHLCLRLMISWYFMIFHVSFQLGRTSDPPRWFAWFQHPYLVTKYTPNRAKWKNTFSSYKLRNWLVFHKLFAGNCSFLEYLEYRGHSLRFQKSAVNNSWKDSPNLTTSRSVSQLKSSFSQTEYENRDFLAKVISESSLAWFQLLYTTDISKQTFEESKRNWYVYHVRFFSYRTVITPILFYYDS